MLLLTGSLSHCDARCSCARLKYFSPITLRAHQASLIYCTGPAASPSSTPACHKAAIIGSTRDPPNIAAQSEGVASMGILHLSLPFLFLSLPGKVGHPAAPLIVLPFISQKQWGAAEGERGWVTERRTHPHCLCALLAGGLSQLRRVGKADEGTWVGGGHHRQPLHSGLEPGHTDVQANSYCQGNGRYGGPLPLCLISCTEWVC